MPPESSVQITLELRWECLPTPTREHLAMPMFFIVPPVQVEVLLASSKYISGMLLNILQCMEVTPIKKEWSSPKGQRCEAEKPWSRIWFSDQVPQSSSSHRKGINIELLKYTAAAVREHPFGWRTFTTSKERCPNSCLHGWELINTLLTLHFSFNKNCYTSQHSFARISRLAVFGNILTLFPVGHYNGIYYDRNPPAL